MYIFFSRVFIIRELNLLCTIAKTQAQIHLELVQLERQSYAAGEPKLHAISACAFLVMGLELEEHQ